MVIGEDSGDLYKYRLSFEDLTQDDIEKAIRPRELRELFACMLEEGTLTQELYDELIAVLDKFDRMS